MDAGRQRDERLAKKVIVLRRAEKQKALQGRAF